MIFYGGFPRKSEKAAERRPRLVFRRMSIVSAQSVLPDFLKLNVREVGSFAYAVVAQRRVDEQGVFTQGIAEVVLYRRVLHQRLVEFLLVDHPVDAPVAGDNEGGVLAELAFIPAVEIGGDVEKSGPFILYLLFYLRMRIEEFKYADPPRVRPVRKHRIEVPGGDRPLHVLGMPRVVVAADGTVDGRVVAVCVILAYVVVADRRRDVVEQIGDHGRSDGVVEVNAESAVLAAAYIDEDFACIYGPPPVKRVHTCKKCGYSWETELMIDDERWCPQCGGSAPVTSEEEWE